MTVRLLAGEVTFGFSSQISHAAWLLTDQEVQHQPPGLARQPSHQADQAMQVSILRLEDILASSRLSYSRSSKQG